MKIEGSHRGCNRVGLRLASLGKRSGAALGLALLLVSGCHNKRSGSMQGRGGTPQVGVVTVRSSAVPITNELPGRLDAVRIAQVRARVTGIILKRLFQEGSDVKEGQVLFQIDPAPFQAIVDNAKGALARAEATRKQAEAKAARYKVLVGVHAVSQQDYDDAEAAAEEGRADVTSAQAALETANLNLGYATVTAPIAGRIGAAKVTEGALVSQSAATEMAVIQQLDPIYFDFTQSSTEVLRLRRELEKGQLKRISSGEAKVTLLLEDGTIYPHEGKLLFSDITVDPTTGMITLRAEFPNPEHLLLPGMFARARLEQAVESRAILVSQRGVTHGPGGSASALVVGPDDKVSERTVKVGEAMGSEWVVTEGLKPGDRVIVSGLQKVRPGMTVKAVPFQTATNAAASGASEEE